MFNIPNFITNKRVTAKVSCLNKKSKNSLENKIVLIENADPGYDWILQRKLKALLLNMVDLIPIWQLELQS